MDSASEVFHAFHCGKQAFDAAPVASMIFSICPFETRRFMLAWQHGVTVAYLEMQARLQREAMLDLIEGEYEYHAWGLELGSMGGKIVSR